MMHTVIHNAQPIIIQLYNESLQLFRLAADGHGYYLPSEQHRDRIRAWFDLRVRIEKCEPQEVAVPEPRFSALCRNKGALPLKIFTPSPWEPGSGRTPGSATVCGRQR